MDADDEPKVVDGRQERGLAIAKSSRLKAIVAGKWYVPSQSQATGGYVVDYDDGSCTCPDYETRALKCKHVWAVEYARHLVIGDDGERVVTETLKVTYRQNWPAYNAAQMGEKREASVLLRALCDGIHNPPQTGRGRPRAALGDVVFAATMKVFTGFSGRRAMSDLDAFAKEGLIDRVPSYNTVFDYMGSNETTPLLRKLVSVSALPLAGIETRFAIDGTGFAAHTHEGWFDEKHGRVKRIKDWVKAHVICGVDTHIITAAEVTKATFHDSPLLPQLVRETAEGFTVQEVLADKGYIGRKNLAAIEDVGGTPYICFKSSNKPDGPDPWRRAYHMFAAHREEWLEHYHQRSNVEALFSSMKRKFGDSVSARVDDTKVNEVLLKCLCHNLSAVVHAIHELNLVPKFWTQVEPKKAG